MGTCKKDLTDPAIRTFEQSVVKDPDNPIYHYHLGLADPKSGNVGRGRQSLQAALKLRPGYADAQRALKSVAG